MEAQESPAKKITPRNSGERISRRTALKRIGGTAITLAAFLEACGNPQGEMPSCMGGFFDLPSDCRRMPATEIPAETRASINETIQPIVRLLPEKFQKPSLYLHPVEKLAVPFTGTYGLRDELSIHMFYNNGSQVPPGWLQQIIAYHETLHAFDDTGLRGADRRPVSVNDSSNKVYSIDAFYPIASEVSYFTDGNYTVPASNSSDFRVHNRELYAKTLTVMRFYPDQFLEKIKGLNNAQDRRISAGYALDCLNSIVARARPVISQADLPYPVSLYSNLTLLSR